VLTGIHRVRGESAVGAERDVRGFKRLEIAQVVCRVQCRRWSLSAASRTSTRRPRVVNLSGKGLPVIVESARIFSATRQVAVMPEKR